MEMVIIEKHIGEMNTSITLLERDNSPKFPYGVIFRDEDVEEMINGVMFKDLESAKNYYNEAVAIAIRLDR